MPATKSSFTEIDNYRNTETFTEESGHEGGITRTTRRAVRLYDTMIFDVSWNDGLMILNHGGHKTATTKRRMNEALDAADLPYKVRQISGEWFLMNEDGEKVQSFNGKDRLAFWL